VIPKNEIFTRVKKNIEEICQVKPQQVKASSLLTTDLGVDSLKIAELSIAFENEFGVTCFLPDLLSGENPYTLTVDSLVTFVTERIEENQ
jgi:acyl carrier protein